MESSGEPDFRAANGPLSYKKTSQIAEVCRLNCMIQVPRQTEDHFIKAVRLLYNLKYQEKITRRTQQKLQQLHLQL